MSACVVLVGYRLANGGWFGTLSRNRVGAAIDLVSVLGIENHDCMALVN